MFGAPYARIDRLSLTDKIKVPDITSVVVEWRARHQDRV